MLMLNVSKYHIICILFFFFYNDIIIYKNRDKECIFRRIQCEYCTVDIPYIEYENHVMYCSSQTVRCDYCYEYIILSNYKQHLAMKHNINVLLFILFYFNCI